MRKLFWFLPSCIVLFSNNLHAQQKLVHLSFTVSVKDAATHIYHVQLKCEGIKKDNVEFKLSAWTPGYYQFMKYSDNVSGFTAATASGDLLQSEKNSDNGWMVNTKNSNSIILNYDVKATRAFVAANYLDADRGYISPAGVFVYPDGM